MTSPARPSLLKLAMESRACLDWAGYVLATKAHEEWPKAQGTPVLLLPGLATNPWAMLPLRHALAELGHQPHDWNLGFNTGPSAHLLDQLTQHVKELSKEYKQSVSLVGWSLGGAMARAVAARVPRHVRCVIGLGSPLNQHPVSHLDPVFSLLSPHKPSDPQLFKWLGKPLSNVPLTSIASVDDGLLSWESSTLGPGALQETILLRGVNHLGFPVHPYVLWLIHDRLRQDPSTWVPYRGRSKWDHEWKAPLKLTSAWRSVMMKG